MRTKYIHRPDHPLADEFGFVDADKYYAAPAVGVKRIGVIADVEPFKSPIDGTVLGSRTDIREHEKRHGVRQIGNDWCGRERPQWWDRRKAIAYGKDKA